MTLEKRKPARTSHENAGNGALATLFAEIGGMPTCQRLSENFHHRIAGDSILREMFPGNLALVTEHLALFLAETLGGPAVYTAKRGKPRLVCRHAHLRIGPEEVERWLGHMFAVMKAESLPDSAQQLLRDYFTTTAASLSDPFLSFYDLSLDALQICLQENPALAVKSNMGRTLLSAAAGAWDLPRVRMLLEHGADVHTKDQLNHTPLSHAAGAQWKGREVEGGAVVALLLQKGAEVNERCGPGRITALHQAARRGTLAVAEVLLAAGADIEATDAKGETPLRRAVNCGQEGAVRLLIIGGANPLAVDKQSRTSLDAARQHGIRAALQNTVRV